jgi:hypothetical protein
MKYMDGSIDESEAEMLGKHLSGCPQCAADFELYDDIIKGFSEMELIPAPEGFEERVMRRVAELPSLAVKLNSNIENMMCLIWGGVSVLFGIGFLMTLNRGAIIEYLYSYPELSGYASMLSLISEYGEALAGSLMINVNQIITSAAEYASAYRSALVAVLAVLTALQILVHRRSNAE